MKRPLVFLVAAWSLATPVAWGQQTTSDEVNCSKGPRMVARKDLRTVRLLGGHGARVGLAILGAVGGYAAAVAGTFARGDEFSVGAGQAALFGVTALGGAIGGYYLGKHISKDTTLVVQ